MSEEKSEEKENCGYMDYIETDEDFRQKRNSKCKKSLMCHCAYKV